jgi:hypothetical protein
LENAQRATLSRHFQKSLVFQRKFEKKIAGPNREEQRKKEKARRKSTYRPNRWD